jgi:type IV pilus biogenesis/stability protein PilW
MVMKKKRIAIFVWVLVLSFSMMGAMMGMTGCASDQKKLKKQRAEAIRDLGEAYMAQREYTRALREFLKAEEIYPDDPYLHNDLGVTYMAKGNLSLAIGHFHKALKIKPDYSPARNNLGSAYLEQENWEAAIECFKAVKDDLLYGTPHYPMTNLGFVYFKLGDYEQAVYYYTEALEIAPNFPMAHHGLGQVYMAMGKYDEAVKTLEKAVEKAPNEARICLDLGRAYKKVHENNKAYETFKKAASLAEDDKIRLEAETEAKKAWEH